MARFRPLLARTQTRPGRRGRTTNRASTPKQIYRFNVIARRRYTATTARKNHEARKQD
ncbi:hypothetical protein [Lysobacter gummosus]|uniref:hypothetical protein n=1 Tax=Lysobacter gummosus TaxID=262324 RepID=UPI00362CF8B9